MPSAKTDMPVAKVTPQHYQKMRDNFMELLSKGKIEDADAQAMMAQQYMEGLNLQIAATKVHTIDYMFKEFMPKEMKEKIYSFGSDKVSTTDVYDKLMAKVPSTYCGHDLHSDEESKKIKDAFFLKFRPSLTTNFTQYVLYHVFTDKQRNEFVITDKDMSGDVKNTKLIDLFQTKYETKPKTLAKYFNAENFDKFWTLVWDNDSVSTI